MSQSNAMAQLVAKAIIDKIKQIYLYHFNLLFFFSASELMSKSQDKNLQRKARIFQ